MLAAALLASLLTQAEQAPPETAPAPPAGTPAPAATAPAPAPAAAPTPATPGPAPSAPASTPPPGPGAPPPVLTDEPPPVPANGVSVQLRYAYRIGSEGDVTGPAAGLSIGGEYEHRLHAFRNGVELGLALDFFYDRFSKEVVAAEGIVDRTLSQTTFTVMETTAWRYSDMRLFAAIGGGLAVGYFVSPDQLSGSISAMKPLARGVLGFDFAIASRTFAVLRFDYNMTFIHESFDAGGAAHPLFGDFFDAGAGLLVRF